MSNVMNTVFDDGSPSEDASDPMKTVGSFLSAGIIFGAVGEILELGAMSPDVISNSLEGGGFDFTASANEANISPAPTAEINVSAAPETPGVAPPAMSAPTPSSGMI